MRIGPGVHELEGFDGTDEREIACATGHQDEPVLTGGGSQHTRRVDVAIRTDDVWSLFPVVHKDIDQLCATHRPDPGDGLPDNTVVVFMGNDGRSMVRGMQWP